MKNLCEPYESYVFIKFKPLKEHKNTKEEKLM